MCIIVCPWRPKNVKYGNSIHHVKYLLVLLQFHNLDSVVLKINRPRITQIGHFSQKAGRSMVNGTLILYKEYSILKCKIVFFFFI